MPAARRGRCTSCWPCRWGARPSCWFAMSSGHLHGARATVGMVAALAQVALAVGAADAAFPRALRRRGRRQRGDRRLLAGRGGPAGGVRRDRRHRRGVVRGRRARGRRARPAAGAGQRVVVGDLGHRLGRPRGGRGAGDRRTFRHDDRPGHRDGIEAVRDPGRLGGRTGALGHRQGPGGELQDVPEHRRRQRHRAIGAQEVGAVERRTTRPSSPTSCPGPCRRRSATRRWPPPRRPT